jgi:hypothetical protein
MLYLVKDTLYQPIIVNCKQKSIIVDYYKVWIL